MEIYTEENNKLKQHIFQTFGDEEDPSKALQKAMTLNNEEMQAHPILREWYNTDVFSKIERCYREKNEKNDAACLHDFSYDFVKKWQAEGRLRDDIDAELIVALFYSITYLDKQKEAIGIQFFPQVTNLLAVFAMKCLSLNSSK